MFTKEVIYIQILGREYPVDAGAGDALYINSLARYVEEKMEEIKQNTNIVDTSKIAVLAALNIADEFFRLKQSRESVNTEVEQKADEMISLLDAVLK